MARDSRQTSSGEFALIEKYFAPLARAYPGALGLTDDAALIEVPPGKRLVITTDALVATVHFRGDEPADLVARKALRVNLSDLAAMGAEPLGYTLATVLPRDIDEAWIARFAAGLAADQAEFGIALLGGDTTATPGPLTLSITALGLVPADGALLRRGARPGDRVMVSGTIGDAALGLDIIEGRLTGLAEADAEFLVERYRLPQPRLALGGKLPGIASAGLDLSDGLVADLGHIAVLSGVAMRLLAERIPLSEPARRALAANPALLERVLAGGDDYELALTISPANSGRLMKLARAAGVVVTEIGIVEAGAGVRVADASGRDVTPISGGYAHF
jgi:thiamine-monophosphate kinase